MYTTKTTTTPSKRICTRTCVCQGVHGRVHDRVCTAGHMVDGKGTAACRGRSILRRATSRVTATRQGCWHLTCNGRCEQIKLFFLRALYEETRVIRQVPSTGSSATEARDLPLGLFGTPRVLHRLDTIPHIEYDQANCAHAPYFERRPSAKV